MVKFRAFRGHLAK
jgi:uncharacterized protein (DUF1015 family)